MENQDFSLDLSEEEPLTLPHFDDEETIQSARPVVPLHEVERASRTKHRLLLAGALCAATLVGALTASLITGPRRVQDSRTANNEGTPITSGDFVAPSSEGGGATVNPNEAIMLDSDATSSTDDSRVESGVRSVRRQQTQIARATKKVEKVAQAPQVPEPDDESVSSDGESQRESWREARRLRRERRINARRAGDGLTRIQEIFEGSPRP
ncbi:MAG TPA: hypothetical protein VJS64_07350 [Pyrinomonadaceae bacterium]|nr:hypothetical protein [Pyrinomonadaceae bacterium]